MQTKVIAVAAALVVVFLAGFVPQYTKANRLESELQQVRAEVAGAELRDLIGLAYLQASQKNFGLAAETASRFFGRAQGKADLVAARDKVTAELAKGDPAAVGSLQDLVLKTRAATGK